MKTKSGSITASVFRCSLGDCTNGGVTSKANEVLLIWGDEPAPEDAHYPVLRLTEKNVFGRIYIHAEPVAPVPAGYAGYMMGGNFIHSCDSRFPFPYPIPVHDRTEA